MDDRRVTTARDPGLDLHSESGKEESSRRDESGISVSEVRSVVRSIFEANGLIARPLTESDRLDIIESRQRSFEVQAGAALGFVLFLLVLLLLSRR